MDLSNRGHRRAAGGGQILLVLLMCVGRIGPRTLAQRERVRRYALPEERPIVG